MKYICLIFIVGCATTLKNDSAMLKYRCVESFVSQKVNFNDASKWCSDNFKRAKGLVE